MLLRSSSTPVLGSLLSSIAESPSNHFETNGCSIKHLAHNHNKVSFHPSPGSLHFTTVSCSSSPISPSVAECSDFDRKGFRRAQSEGNLEELANVNWGGHEEFYSADHPNKISGRYKHLMLETIPSFSFYNSRARCEEEDESDVEDEEEEEEEEEEEILLTGRSTNGGKVMVMARKDSPDEFAINNKENIYSNEEVAVMENVRTMGFEEKGVWGKEEMFLAKGLGIDVGAGGRGGGGGGSGNEPNEGAFGGDGGDNRGVEEYYKKMVDENPGNPLFLRNYAQFLYQSKRDLLGAEEYYSRAILADPGDGDVLSQYAKLVWELHGDEERASSYFERAVQAAPQDSHVHAAYASFLWETEEDEDECHVPTDLDSISPQFHGAPASV